MAEGPIDDTLPIRCPSCGQRFKVGPDLMGRMVECGTCEHRFRVNDDVLVRSKRHYPGDRKDMNLERFSRVPMASSLPAGFQPAHYNQDPLPQRGTGPTSPLRLLCGMIAAVIIVMLVYLLAFGNTPGGMLDGADLTKRLMLAVFGSLVATALIAAANPQARAKALLSALVISAGVIALPFFIKPDIKTGKNQVGLKQSSDELSALIDQNSEKPVTPEGEMEEIKKEMGYSALEKETVRNSAIPGKATLGVWLRDLKEYHKPQVGNYIIRATDATDSSHMYPRPPDYLMVLIGVDDDLDKLAEVCKRFGEVKRTFPDLRVVEVVMRNDAFQEGPLDKLTDPNNPSFYELNRRELESIDLERARHAIQHLTNVEPKSYRPDISKRMQQLLKESDRDMQGQIAQALETWSQDGDGSLEAVRAAAEKIRADKFEMPETLISFLAKRRDISALPMVDELWVADATKWETAYANLGAGAEPTLLTRFPNLPPTLKMSAIRILGRIGTAKSLPVIEAARPGATGEIRGMIDAAAASIKSRQ
ncbi:MAG: hypothetical protein JWO82_4157 [Akkermansiaceae bacterium]|nr:hypothetical protein [Akkermansiaceae bacterium]